MTKVGKDYRRLLIDMVSATGKFITDNAEGLVDRVDLMTDFTIRVSYDQDSYPIITIEQSHAMKEVLEVMYD